MYFPNTKIVVCTLKEDLIVANYIGCGAYDYCVKHNLFHLKEPKGTTFYLTANYFNGFTLEDTQDPIIAYLSNPKFSSTTNAYTLKDLKTFGAQHKIKDLYTCITERHCYIGHSPTSDQLQFVKYMDNTLLSKLPKERKLL